MPLNYNYMSFLFINPKNKYICNDKIMLYSVRYFSNLATNSLAVKKKPRVVVMNKKKQGDLEDVSLVRFRILIMKYYWMLMQYYKLLKKKYKFKPTIFHIKLLKIYYKKRKDSKRSWFIYWSFKKFYYPTSYEILADWRNYIQKFNKKFTKKDFYRFRSKRLVLKKDYQRLALIGYREAKKWKKYLLRFRMWYSIFRFLYTKRENKYSKILSIIYKFDKRIANSLFRVKSFIKAVHIWRPLNSNKAMRDLKKKKFLDITINRRKSLIKFINNFWNVKNSRIDSKLKKRNPLFDSLYYERFLVTKSPWKSRYFWALKRHISIFRRRRFKKRFHLFRLERIVKRKKKKKRKTKTFLQYSHQRFQKFRLYYTTLGHRQFSFVFQHLQHFKKNVAQNIICVLELRLEFFLYRINFVPSKYFAKQLILHKGILVNNKTICNKNYQIKVGDTINIEESFFSLIFNNLFSRLLLMTKKILTINPKYSNIPLVFLHPDYVEVDYGLLVATIIRLPVVWEVFVPKYIERDPLNRSLPQIYNSYL